MYLLVPQNSGRAAGPAIPFVVRGDVGREPLLFMASSAYVLVSSVLYTRLGAMAGLAVLAAGPVLLAALQWFVGQRAATQQE